MLRFGRRHREARRLERTLAAHLPRIPEALADELVAQIAAETPRRRPARRRFAQAAVFSAAVLAGLAAVGGLSYAATVAVDIAHSVHTHAVDLGSRMSVERQISYARTAANDQYGGGSGSGSGGGGSGGGSGSGGSTSGGGGSTSGGGGGTGGGGGGTGGGSGGGGSTQTTTATATSSGTVTLQPSSPDTAPVAVSWAAGTFTTPTAVTVATTAPTSSAIVGSVPAILTITAVDPSTGQQIHTLAAPMSLVFEPPPGGFQRGYVPLVSADGATWTAMPALASPALPSGFADGYYVWRASDGAAHPAGTIIVFTRHLTVFAVLYSANAKVSESGRALPQAGSGLFGDPTRNHSGPPAMHRAAERPTILAKRKQLVLDVSFMVDEQAALGLSVFDAHGNEQLIIRNGTIFRGSRLTGGPLKSLKLLVLRPGTLHAVLRLSRTQILPGYRYRLRVSATDYDGHTVVRYIPFHG